MGDVENGMVLDSLWRERERTPKEVGECAGCEETISANESYLDLDLHGHQYLLHEKAECTYQFVSEMAICRSAGEA
ncbi:MAG: hypothetical protein K0Q73_5959 [Paenibacillus sp.]|jgi:extradiol dioxygenase family protein|nr:hypothetical protein [Paenibacillus sp.]